MENLTPKQNEIISNLVNEFTKINEANSVTISSNPLLKIANELDTAKNQEIVDRASIEARNKVAIANNREQCEEDADELQCLLNELDRGLFVNVEHYKDASYIQIKKEGWNGPRIQYDLPNLGHQNYKYITNIELLGNTHIMYGRYLFTNLEEIMDDEDFKKNFIAFLNR